MEYVLGHYCNIDYSRIIGKNLEVHQQEIRYLNCELNKLPYVLT